MKNLMDEYIDFTSKKIKKYIKIILRTKYDEEIVQEFLKTYINSRYYNINEENSRAFYLKITDSLTRKQESLKTKVEKDKLEIVDATKQIFTYMLFFDNVRKVENFKNINSIREVIVQLLSYCEQTLGLKAQESIENSLYNEITSDLLDKDIYLDNFETDDFLLNFEKTVEYENVYYTKLDYNIKVPSIYSDEAIDKVFNSGTVAENKLVVEYELLSVVTIRDILSGDFKDKYIAEFNNSLFKKTQKLDSIFTILNNQALQDKIYITITYRDWQKNNSLITGYMKEGFNFVVELDDYFKDVSELAQLAVVFKYVIVPSNIQVYKEVIKQKTKYTNLLEK